ncbi:MAG: MBL fold metallo-hydrolase [Oscillospiraceae bacterium]|nr:MBL fold metallo-hydrolase [Oscillospiraceae bacterium]
MLFEQIKTNGLGCYSYVIGCPASGVVAVVDPRRDVDIYLQIANEYDLSITHIFETHVHADHVSGAQELRALTGAEICIHESTPINYEAIKLSDGDEFHFGNAILRVLHTPGHTPGSVSFLVTDLARSSLPSIILTGDLLFVGDIGRPDLPGDEILDEQVESLYNSLYKTLGDLPDYLEVYPAHGEGSLCGQGMSAKPSSTLGYERLTNPMLRFSDYKSFKQRVLSNLPMRPPSFEKIINTNLDGASISIKRVAEEHALSAEEAVAMYKEGATILDLRSALSFGAAHIPGSINVDFTDGPKLNWVGMATPPYKPLVLVLPSDQEFEAVCTELRRIGCDDVKGWLKGGFDTWLESGMETASFTYISATSLLEHLAGDNPPTLIDVRTPAEFNSTSIKDAVHVPIDLIISMDSCTNDAVTQTVVVCQSGFRAAIAASILQTKGCNDLTILSGGMIAWENIT